MVNGLWYGAWPPVPYVGGDVEKDDAVIWRTWPYTLACLIIALLFLVGGEFLHERHLLSHILSEVGIAVLVAGIVGTAIDWIFSKRLAEDVFKATVGYLLPDELKPELQWIYDQAIICTESRQEYEFIKQDTTVIMNITCHRTLKNIGRSKQSLTLGAGIDKGFSPDYSSRFLEFGYILDGHEQRKGEGDLALPADEWAIQTPTEQVSLLTGQEVTYWWKSTQLKRSVDDDHIVFSYPTVNPLVIIRTAEGLIVEVKVAHREKLKSLGSGEYRLAATLLPDQHIQVRWRANV